MGGGDVEAEAWEDGDGRAAGMKPFPNFKSRKFIPPPIGSLPLTRPERSTFREFPAG